MDNALKPDCGKLRKLFTEILEKRNNFDRTLKETKNLQDIPPLKNLQSNLEHQISTLWESLSNIPKDWQDFYQTEFNLDLSKIRIKIPEKQEGFDRLIIIAQNLTSNQAYEACEINFPCYRYIDDLNTAVTTNDRNPTKPYAIWVRDNQGPDNNLKNTSANQIKAQNIPTETLTERLIHELKYFISTNQHLDTDTITLCSGSRHQDGNVPSVRWRGVEMSVHWSHPDSSGVDLRSRQVVSF